MFSMLSKFDHRREMRESKDEILIGEIVRAMARLGYPAIGFKADSGYQSVKFKPVKDPILHTILVTLDRKTGGSALQDALIGSKAVIRLQLEVKNFLADPDDLIKMHKTDFQNILKVSALGDIKLNHQLNSILGTKQIYIDINNYVSKGEEGAKAIVDLLNANISQIREKLVPYKKA
jgi:hypothetical protein